MSHKLLVSVLKGVRSSEPIAMISAEGIDGWTVWEILADDLRLHFDFRLGAGGGEVGIGDDFLTLGTDAPHSE